MVPRFLRFWNLQRQPNRAGDARTTPALASLRLEILEDRSMPSLYTGTISGIVYTDPYDTQVYSPSDAGISGVTVTLNGTTTQGTAISNVTATTDANGNYSFLNVLPGTYQVASSSISGFAGGGTSTTPTASITMNPGATITENLGVEGGLAPTGISIAQFTTETTNSAYNSSPAGTGQGLGNYRSDSSPVAATIANQTVDISSSPTMLDMYGYFGDPDATDSEVTFNITNGGQQESFNVTLFDTTAPQTVANFLDYVKAGDYNNALFTRLVSGFVLQGGGLQLDSAGTGINPTPVLPAVPNEYGASNTTDTIAMALSSGNPNSGTNQFFFNLADNSSNLNSQKFTVFGQLTDTTSDLTLSNLATTTTKDESSSSVGTANPSVDLTDLPLTNYSGTNFPTDATASNYMVINSITIDHEDEFLTFSATSSNPSLVTPSISNEWLSLNYAAGQTGTATITVQATDRYGATVDQTFNVTVQPVPPSVTSVAIAPNSITDTTTLTATPTGTDSQSLPITYAYQWLDNGTAISGATSATLTLPAGVKVGDQFTVAVTPSDSELTGTAFTSPSATIATINPNVTIALPTVQSMKITPNSLTDATQLTVTPTSTDPLSKPLDYTYQWYQNNTAITGATSETLTLPSTINVGDKFTVTVTPSDGTFTGPSFTSGAAIINSNTVGAVTIELPTITSVAIAPNNASDATTLTATPTGTDPEGTSTYAYQWYQNGTAISNATSATLTLPSSVDPGDKFTVTVTPSDSTFTGTAITPAAAVVQSTSPVVIELPTVTSVTVAPNSATDATTLTATPFSTDPDSLPVTYAYQWFQNGAAISGATSATLNLPAVSNGDNITVQVTPTDGTFTGPAYTTGAVTIQNGTAGSVTLTPPVIQSVTINEDSTTSPTLLSSAVSIQNPASLAYQWLQNNTAINGQTSATLKLSTLTTATGNFTLQVTPSYGTVAGSAVTSNLIDIS